MSATRQRHVSRTHSKALYLQMLCKTGAIEPNLVANPKELKFFLAVMLLSLKEVRKIL
jgi:hypothetical protein